MATEASTEESGADDMLNHDPLEHCPICHQRFTEPKMLDCLHSYCLKCLEDLVPNKQRNVRCPVCKQNTVLPEQGVNGLASCPSLASLLLVDDEAAQRSKVVCEACDQGQEAISRCVDCEDYLCKDCQEAHERMLKMRAHEVVALHDAQLPASDDIPKCSTHVGQEVCFFCETCQVLICAACTVVAHSQPDHNYVSIDEAEHIFKKEIDELLTKVEAIRLEHKTVRDSTQHSHNRLETLMAEAKEKVSKKAQEYHDHVQQQEQLLQEQITQIKHKRAVEIDITLANQNQSLTNTERTLDTVQNFVAKASPFELLGKKQTILRGIRGVKPAHEHDHGLLHALSFIDFRPGVAPVIEPLGVLLLKEQWKLVREFGNFKMARGVASNSRGHIAVVDSERNFLITVTDPMKGQRRNSMGMKTENLQNPFSVCANSLDQLVVVDSPKVKVFNKESRYLFQFTPSRGDKEEESKSALSALAVDADDQIIVGDRGREVITLHNPEGILIRTLPAPLVENQLAASPNPDQRLIYSSYIANKLTATDYKGNTLFSVNTLSRAKFRNPTGLCCSRTGDIYVAGHLDENDQSGIYYFNPFGEYLGCIALGLCNPLSMALTPKGELAVADKITVKIYHCVQ